MKRALLAPLVALALGLPVAVQAQAPLLYEQRLPDGWALLRYVNTLEAPAAFRSDFDLPRNLGTDGAARVTPFHVIENVEGKTLEAAVAVGAETMRIRFQLTPNAFSTLLLLREGDALVARVIRDATEYNQIRARLTFYNATLTCGPATLKLDPGGQTVLANVENAGMRARTVAPAAARVRTSCAGGRVGPLDLGRLEAGQLHSVWLIAPGGTPQIFRSTDTIAPPGR
jgi:hypothetical protein